MPTGPQRAALERRCADLEAMGAPGPEAKIAKSVSGLLAFYATGRTGDASVDVKLRGFMVAVDDLPAWAVAEAIRRWFRGDCGQHNYEFAPAPATLRQIATDVSRIARGQLVLFRRILNARPDIEPTDEERGRVAEFKTRIDAEVNLAARRAQA